MKITAEQPERAVRIVRHQLGQLRITIGKHDVERSRGRLTPRLAFADQLRILRGCERASASEGAASNGLRGRGTQ